MNTVQASDSLLQLQQDWRPIAAKDPASVVDTTVLGAILTSDCMPEGHPVVLALRSKLPFGELQVKDALSFAGQLYAAIPRPPILVA